MGFRGRLWFPHRKLDFGSVRDIKVEGFGPSGRNSVAQASRPLWRERHAPALQQNPKPGLTRNEPGVRLQQRTGKMPVPQRGGKAAHREQ